MILGLGLVLKIVQTFDKKSPKRHILNIFWLKLSTLKDYNELFPLLAGAGKGEVQKSGRPAFLSTCMRNPTLRARWDHLMECVLRGNPWHHCKNKPSEATLGSCYLPRYT